MDNEADHGRQFGAADERGQQRDRDLDSNSVDNIRAEAEAAKNTH